MSGPPSNPNPFGSFPNLFGNPQNKSSNHGKVIEITSKSDYDTQLMKASKKLIVVDFNANWCGPCQMVKPLYAQLSVKYPNVVFLSVDVDKNRNIRHPGRGIPTFVFIRDRKMVFHFSGANISLLEKSIIQYSPAVVDPFASNGRKIGGVSSTPTYSSNVPKPKPKPKPKPVDNEDFSGVDEMKLAQLLSLGYELKPSARALKQTDGDLEEATAILMSQNTSRFTQGDVKTPQVAPSNTFQETPQNPIKSSPAAAPTNTSQSLEERKLAMRKKIDEMNKIDIKNLQNKQIEDEKRRRQEGRKVSQLRDDWKESQAKSDISARKSQKQRDKEALKAIRRKIRQDKKRLAAEQLAAKKRREGSNAPTKSSTPIATTVSSSSNCNIMFRLSNGARVKHSFLPSDTLASVFAWIAQNRTDGNASFALFSPSHRKIFSGSDMGNKLSDLGFSSRSALDVRPI